MNKFEKIQLLLARKAELNARLELLPYLGTPEVKTINGKEYLYVRRRELNKLTSTYVDVYSDELHNQLLRNNEESKKIKREIRKIDKELALLDYKQDELSPSVRLAQMFARQNRNLIIFNQAILEGISITFSEIELLLEQGIIKNAKADDIKKILNLKRAWEFILDDNVLLSITDLNLISYIAQIVNDGFFYNAGQIRVVPVRIGGSNYIPPIPIESKAKEEINSILRATELSYAQKATKLCLYLMKAQLFNDGNKRIAVIATNHFLISQGIGILAIPHEKVPKFQKMLVEYYEGKNEKNHKIFGR